MKHPIVFAGGARVVSPTPHKVAHITRASVRLVAVWIALLAAVWLVQPAHAQDNVHVVAGGENLSTIARRYGMTMQELAAYNGIVNPNLVIDSLLRDENGYNADLGLRGRTNLPIGFLSPGRFAR